MEVRGEVEVEVGEVEVEVRRWQGGTSGVTCSLGELRRLEMRVRARRQPRRGRRADACTRGLTPERVRARSVLPARQAARRQRARRGGGGGGGSDGARAAAAANGS